MNSQKTIWINLDETKVDITYLDERFKEKGYHFIKKAVSSTEENAILMGSQADAIISTSEPWNKNTLAKIANAGRFIVRYGAGTDNIDIPEATRLGIPIANVPGANAAAVAEVAMLHILNVGRRFAHCVMGCKAHVWPSTITGNELDGKYLGLVGFGNIARQLARMVSGFNVKILAYDAFLDDNGKKQAKDMNVMLVDSIEDIFQKSDIISLHIPLNDATVGSINERLFRLMKPTAYLINTCRGKVINESDLIIALENKMIQGAGLDVLCDEPPKDDNPLLSMDNVFITSHMGAASLESEYRSQVIIADSIIEFFDGKLPHNVINKEVKIK